MKTNRDFDPEDFLVSWHKISTLMGKVGFEPTVLSVLPSVFPFTLHPHSGIYPEYLSLTLWIRFRRTHRLNIPLYTNGGAFNSTHYRTTTAPCEQESNCKEHEKACNKGGLPLLTEPILHNKTFQVSGSTVSVKVLHPSKTSKLLIQHIPKACLGF